MGVVTALLAGKVIDAAGDDAGRGALPASVGPVPDAAPGWASPVARGVHAR